MKRILITLMLCATIGCMNCFAQQSDKNRGYQSYIDFGAQINLEGYQSTVMGVDYIGGYRGGEHFFIGLGIGARYAVESSYSDVTNSVGSNNFYISHHEIEQSVALPIPQLRLPAFLHMRAYISDRCCQPFFALSAGCVISKDMELAIYDDIFTEPVNNITYKTTSLFAEPMFGLNLRMGLKFAINIQAGCIIQSHPYFSIYDAAQGVARHRVDVGYAAKIGFAF